MGGESVRSTYFIVVNSSHFEDIYSMDVRDVIYYMLVCVFVFFLFHLPLVLFFIFILSWTYFKNQHGKMYIRVVVFMHYFQKVRG